MLTLKPVCPRCHKKLLREEDDRLKLKYPFYCPECDENYFSFEADWQGGEIKHESGIH